MRKILVGAICAAFAIAGLVAASLPSVAQKSSGPSNPPNKDGSGLVHKNLGF